MTRRIIMAWTLMFAACGGDVVEVPPVEEEPWSALEWRVGSTELGDVTAYAEHGDRLAVCTSTQAVLLAPGLSVRELERQIVLPSPPQRGAVSATGKLDVQRAAEKGFSAYKRQDDGSYTKLAGKDGPKKILGDD